MSGTALLLTGLLVVAQPAPEAGSQYARLPHCVVSLIDDVELPARQPGVLVELLAKEGMVVKEGQVLGRVDDSDTVIKQKAAESRLSVAQERATNDAQVRVAHKLIEYYKAELDESIALNRKNPGIIPDAQVRRQQVSWEKSVLDALAEEMNFKISGLQVKEAEADLEMVQNELSQRQLKSPFEGVVVQLLREQGEWVQGNDPVLRVVRMDKLRVEGFVKNDEVAPGEVYGAPVTIRVQLTGDYEVSLKATINYVSPVIEASGDYRIWADVDNQAGRGGYNWLLRPGVEAEMLIEMKPLN